MSNYDWNVFLHFRRGSVTGVNWLSPDRDVTADYSVGGGIYITGDTSGKSYLIERVEIQGSTETPVESFYMNFECPGYSVSNLKVKYYQGSQLVSTEDVTGTRRMLLRWFSRVGEDAEFSFEFVPTVAKIMRTISVSASPSSGGSVSGGGSYQEGEYVHVDATPAEGYEFVNWTEGGTEVSTSRYYYFTVESNRTLVAHFDTLKYDIAASVSPDGSGTVSGAGRFEEGEICTLTATPASGWDGFKHWMENGGVISSSNPYSFSVNRARNLTAVFYKTVEVIASASPAGSGTVTGARRYQTGDRVTMEAIPNEGYAFQYWIDDLQPGHITSNPYVFTINENRYLTAVFSQQKRHVTLVCDPTLGGTAEGEGDYLINTEAEVKATANEGYTFENWTKDGVIVSTSAVYRFTVTENVTLRANFAARIYQIAVDADPPAGGTAVAEPPQTTIHGHVICRATAAEGYSFINWTEKGEIVSETAEYRLDDVTDDHQLTAHFGEPVLHHFEIVFDDNGGEGGPGTWETDDYAERIVVTVPDTVPTLEGKMFAGWLVQGTEIILQPGDSETIAADVVYTLIAQWADVPGPAVSAELWYKDTIGWRKVADLGGSEYVFDAPLIQEGTHVGTDASLHEMEWTDVIIEKRRR